MWIGLVGGEGVVPYLPESSKIILSPLLEGNKEKLFYKFMLFLQGLIVSIPIVHIHDVCQAHIFSMEKSTMFGRFLCASDYPVVSEISNIYMTKYVGRPIFQVGDEKISKKVVCRSSKLQDLGFEYKYKNVEMIIDKTLKYATKMGIEI